jgi:hypothetical protein
LLESGRELAFAPVWPAALAPAEVPADG